MSEIIRLENVIKMTENGYRAVNGVSISVHKRERVAICGEPGSGKSMLMRLISGMERPSEGKIFVSDKAVHEMDSDTAAEFRSKTFGILQRKPAFMINMTVLENVAIPLGIRGVPDAERQKAAKEQLKTLGLQHSANARPSQLSVLETHMAAIARALITQPQILLTDDLAAGLSAKDFEHIKGILHALWRFGEYTLLEFSGTESRLFPAERTVTMADGKIQEERT